MDGANGVFFIPADIESGSNHLGAEAIDVGGNLVRYNLGDL